MTRVAVVGSGISGLGAAWLLNRKHEVELFEAADRLGGHTHTVEHASDAGSLALDTGFIVFNEKTYPLLCRLFDRLGVASQDSDMSFSVSSRMPDFEYGTVGLGGILAQPANLARPWFYHFLRDIVRFGQHGRTILDKEPDPSKTVLDLLDEGGFGDAFASYYLKPMVGAIWSSGDQGVDDFPRDTLLRFFANHGLLQLSGHPQWRTVTGGSHSYVKAMTRDFADRIHLGMGVRSIHRGADGVMLELADGSRHQFDHVVVASHADQALAILGDASTDERRLLGAWSYSVNDAWLHTDTSLMPRRRRAWASWNVAIDGDGAEQRVSITYDLSRLQRIAGATRYLVSLNPGRPPAPGTVLQRMSYTHPVYTRDSVATQAELLALNGSRRTHFCGAYLRNGFHEDGLWSAVQVAADFGVTL